jgi:hypothetical protein
LDKSHITFSYVTITAAKALRSGMARNYNAGNQVRLRRPQDGVEMVAHRALGLHLPCRFLESSAEGAKEPLPVSVVAEYRLALVSAVHDVVHRPGILDAQFARYDFGAINSSEKCQ